MLTIPMFICLAGLAGSLRLPADTAVPASVTFSRLSAVSSDDAGSVQVQFHEPVILASIPAGRNTDSTDKIRNSIFDSRTLQADLGSMEMIQLLGEEELRGMDNTDKIRKRKITGLMSPNKENNDGRATGEVSGGWGNGWLLEAMLMEEDRVRMEFEMHEKRLESEPLRRNTSISETFRADGYERSGRYVERFGSAGGGLQNEWKSPAKPSFKFESWKPKK